MCFDNDQAQLSKYRERKRPIRVWKTGHIDDATGLVTTKYCGNHAVVWKQGTIVFPHKIRKPLRHGDCCTAGLYFYLQGHLPNDRRLTPHHKKTMITIHDSRRGLVLATVNPDDVIAVEEDGRLLCAVQAKVIKSPNPNQRLRRVKFLSEHLKNAKESIAHRKETRELWESEEEDRQEAFELIMDEIKALKEKG